MNELTVKNKELIWIKNPLDDVIGPLDGSLCISRCQVFGACNGHCYFYFTW